MSKCLFDFNLATPFLRCPPYHSVNVFSLNFDYQLLRRHTLGHQIERWLNGLQAFSDNLRIWFALHRPSCKSRRKPFFPHWRTARIVTYISGFVYVDLRLAHHVFQVYVMGMTYSNPSSRPLASHLAWRTPAEEVRLSQRICYHLACLLCERSS